MDRSLGGAGIHFRAAGTRAGRGVAVHGRPLLGRPLGLCFRGGLKTGENTGLADASMSACDRHFLPQPTRVPSVTHANSKPHDLQQLDALTGGAFTAATSGDRAARIREWLATAPAQDLMQEVFKELSVKDKGAARPLREKLDELRRAKTQDALAADWATRGQVLLDTPRLNIADAMAWQRDAAKAGAPLSREPLASLKAALSERIKVVEDLQNQAMVQREAAVLLAQRIELLSTKGWKDAHAVADALRTDVTHWQAQADALEGDANWSCVDTKYTPMIESSRAQLLVVWDAFSAALGQAVAADADPAAPLPPVPVWADQLRAARGLPVEAAARPAKPKVDPAVREEQRQKAAAAVTPVLEKVEQEVSEGHGKASAGAAAALRNAFKEHGRHLDSALEARVHAALGAAGELEGWQRWRADQLREELVAKAEALLQRKPKVKVKPARAGAATEVAAAETADADAASPTTEPASPASDAVATGAAHDNAVPEIESAAPEGEPGVEVAAEEAADTPSPTEGAVPELDKDAGTDAAVVTSDAAQGKREPLRAARPPKGEDAAPVPVMGGRKMQETLRQLREQWKTVDQGGVPNHALWKRFDEACNEAHKVVEVWLDKLKAEAAAHKAQRMVLIDELKAWTQRNVERTEPHEWKAFSRALHQFSDRWRDAGHLSEKAFAELQPLWKASIHAAAAPLEAAQKESLERRHAMIEEAKVLGAAPVLRIDAVKALQHRWQAEAQSVPMERKSEQKLWDAFRKPIDDAFNRKTQEREKADQALGQRDRVVLDAAKALEAANASGDAQKIRAAMTALDAALRGQAQAAAVVAQMAPTPAEIEQKQALPSVNGSESAIETGEMPASPTTAETGTDGGSEVQAAPADAGVQAAAPAEPPKPAPKRVIAMRGDDRPGMKKAEPAAAGRGGKFGDRKDGPRGPGRPGDNKFEPRRDDRGPGARGPREDDRGGRFGGRPAFEDRGPRLGDTAFRAQREALEHAEAALRKLAAQAHGEALTNLLAAWQHRKADEVPGQQELGRAVTPAVRGAWVQAVAGAPKGDAAEALLRLEMAAELPTPAEHLDARRALQLKLLTRRNDPTPAQTWGQDAAAVLASPFDATQARRVQNVLKALLKG